MGRLFPSSPAGFFPLYLYFSFFKKLNLWQPWKFFRSILHPQIPLFRDFHIFDFSDMCQKISNRQDQVWCLWKYLRSILRPLLPLCMDFHIFDFSDMCQKNLNGQDLVWRPWKYLRSFLRPKLPLFTDFHIFRFFWQIQTVIVTLCTFDVAEIASNRLSVIDNPYLMLFGILNQASKLL